MTYVSLMMTAVLGTCAAYGAYGEVTVSGEKGSRTVTTEDVEKREVASIAGGSDSPFVTKNKVIKALEDSPVIYKENPQIGVMEPYRKEVQLSSGYKAILRRDVGAFSHGMPDHWNLEVQTVPSGNIKYDLHIYLGNDGNISSITERIPNKSPFNK